MSDSLAGAMMVCGTSSDAGKTTVVAGLCRLLARRGISVAPFKAQNMALNSAVTVSGHEIGRAQYLQAIAARTIPEVAMNPILLKPTSEQQSQVIINGRAIGAMTAAEYHANKPALFEMVLDALTDLRSRYDVVLIEGAGSPAEINLLDHDIVNLPLAKRAGVKAILVGDIDRGGVFASLFGTVTILPPALAELIGGFVINKLRGDPELLFDGTYELEKLSGIPTFGVVPMLADLGLDAEDSMALSRLPPQPQNASLDVAVIALPLISNFTDIDPLLAEPDVAVRYVRSAHELGRPDLVVIPGSKSTIADLLWLSERGLAKAIASLSQGNNPVTVLGLCGGYQMLGRRIIDAELVEGIALEAKGLGLLDVDTTFGRDKVLSSPEASAFGLPLHGYQIHQGRVLALDDNSSGAQECWLHVNGRAEGFRRGAVYGTTLHGLFEADEFRAQFLRNVAARSGASFTPGDICFSQHRENELDRLADHLQTHLDIDQIEMLISAAL